jgi:dienelactone hydrolase
MFRDVIAPDTLPEDWPQLRKKVFERVMSSMGTPPNVKVSPQSEIIEEYENYGLRHLKIRYRVLLEQSGLAVIVLPKQADAKHPAPAVLCCHGTDYENGKYNALILKEHGNRFRAYAIDLANRGFVTVCPDLYGFGELLTDGRKCGKEVLMQKHHEAIEKFYAQYPNWSLDGRRLWDHCRLLDVLEKMDFIAPKFGVIGLSLGGRSAIYLSALDERIAVSVPIMGISPNLTNAWRYLGSQLSPPWEEYCRKHGGQMLFDYQDMIALNAPRALLIIEAYNDYGLNTYPSANFECYVKGQRVYKLLGKPQCFCTLIHGEGHDALEDTREFAYRWIERWLKS